MSNRERSLTATAIKCLLAITELQTGSGGVRCVDVAANLGVTKPSAHRMIGILQEMGLLKKERFGKAFLTEIGQELAKQYMGCFHFLYIKFEKSLKLPREDCRNAVCAVLAETPEAQLPALAQQLQNDPCASCSREQRRQKNAENHTEN